MGWRGRGGAPFPWGPALSLSLNGAGDEAVSAAQGVEPMNNAESSWGH